MEGPSRSAGMRKSRRSRSQRDRELRRRRRVNLAEERATSLSSGSEREGRGPNGILAPGGRECRPAYGRHRPPRRRKRESVSCEEDIIDGFAIASFISLEALEMDCSLKPNQRTDILGRRNKRKRGPKENGGGPLSEPEEGVPHSYSSSYLKRSSKRRKMEGSHLETGYICDTESDTGDKASDNEIDPVFTVSTRKAVEPAPSNLATSGKSCPPLAARCGGILQLMVTPRVSGLERSQEKSLEPHFPEPVSSSTSSGPISRTSSHSPVTASVAVPRPSPINGNSTRHNGSSPLSDPLCFLSMRSQSIYNRVAPSSTPVKPPSSASSVSASASSMRPPTPSLTLPHRRGSSSSGPLRPPSRASSGALFTASPGLPPPPPLLPPAHSAAAEREGRRSVPGPENNSAAAGRNTPGGPSAPNSGSGSSGRSSQNQASVPPLAFQFHQHNHQHQHTHTHHFTPFLPPPAAPPPMFDKFSSKMDGLYRHPFFPQYPPPSVPGIAPVIPPAGPFSSLQGAFQPKGPAPDITARLGVVSHHLQTKDHRLIDPFGTSLKISNKPGKWCAMHVHVAWMILSHQRKVKLMQADPHKLDFRSDLPSRYSGAVGLGGALPHDLTRPPSLFPTPGAVNQPSAPFISPSASHSSFFPPAPHLDPYGRSTSFAPLGALGSGAFGGLGSPALAGSVFSPKEPPPGAVGGLPTSNHHDAWSSLHGGPSGFPGGPWVKGVDKRDDRDRGKDMERRDIPHIKDEKDRDSLLYGRQPVRMSPVGPPFKPRSSTPVNHINGHSSGLGGSSGPIEDLTRSLNRDRERDRDGDKRPPPTMSSRAPPLSSSPLVADRDRPRSSSSSVLATPPPSHRSIPSPLDLFARSQAQMGQNLHSDHSQRDGNLPASSAASSSTSSSSSSHAKKSDRTTTPVSKSSLPLPPVKVKEERKEEPEHIPIPLPTPTLCHTFDRPNSHPHHPSSSTPSSCSLSLTPTPGVPLPPHTPNHPTHLQLLERSRIEAILRSSPGAAGLIVCSPGERFSHGPPPGPSQGPHSFTWDPRWELPPHHPHHRREALALRSDPHMALRSDPHLARLFQHRHMFEAERAAAAAAAAASQHPPTSTSAASSTVRPEFGMMPFDRHPHLLDEEKRAQILREDIRYLAMHQHLHHGSHLSSPSHAAAAAAHLEQLHHPGLLAHPLSSGAGPAPQLHPGLYSRFGPINPHHMSNGILTKDLVGALSVGAPPPLIPSIASRSATPPRTSRLGMPGELALYSTHKDGESR